MPILDSCVNAVFEPGNIGSSSGEPPLVIVQPTLERPDNYNPEAVQYSLDFSKFYNSYYLGAL